MLKKRLIKYILFAGVLIISLSIGIFVVIPVLRVPICRGKILKFARQDVELFCPPPDLYRPVLDERINIAAIGRPYTFNFKLKYIGPYFVCIAMYGLDDELYGTGYDLKLKIEVNFYKDKVLLCSMMPTNNYNKSWGLGRGDGKIEGEFETPKDIPIDTNVTCEVIVLAADPNLASHCREPSILISRRSEE